MAQMREEKQEKPTYNEPAEHTLIKTPPYIEIQGGLRLDRFNYIPDFFKPAAAEYGADPLATDANHRRKQVDWHYFQIVVHLNKKEVIDALTLLEIILKNCNKEQMKLDDIAPPVHKLALAMQKDKSNDIDNLNADNGERYTQIHALDTEISPIFAKSKGTGIVVKHELRKNLKEFASGLQAELNAQLANHNEWKPLYDRLKDTFVTPMKAAMKEVGSGKGFETLPDAVLFDPELEKKVFVASYHGMTDGNKWGHIHDVQNEAKKLMTEQCKKESSKGSAKKKGLFNCKWFKAHRDELDMYEYGYVYSDSLDLNAYDISDVQPSYKQSLNPFYYPNQYQLQAQPVVIAGYDAGNAVSMDASMALATLFGISLLSLVLCLLFVVLFCVAAFVYTGMSSTNLKPYPEDDMENQRDRV